MKDFFPEHHLGGGPECREDSSKLCTHAGDGGRKDTVLETQGEEAEVQAREPVGEFIASKYHTAQGHGPHH